MRGVRETSLTKLHHSFGKLKGEPELVAGPGCDGGLDQLRNRRKILRRRWQNQAILGGALGNGGIRRRAKPLKHSLAMASITFRVSDLEEERREIMIGIVI